MIAWIYARDKNWLIGKDGGVYRGNLREIWNILEIQLMEVLS